MIPVCLVEMKTEIKRKNMEGRARFRGVSETQLALCRLQGTRDIENENVAVPVG